MGLQFRRFSLGLFDNAKEASGARVARGWLMW